MATAQSIAIEARRVFPVSDYGFGKFLKMPDTRIVQKDPRNRFDLGLTSPTPRELVNGRYTPGWDCFESSLWIRNQLQESGHKAMVLAAQTPVYPTDNIVIYKEKGWFKLPKLMSITPGVIPSRVKLEKEYSEQELQSAFAEHKFVDAQRSVSGSITTTSAEGIGGSVVKNGFGLFFDNPGTFELSIMTDLVIGGFGRGKHESIFYCPLREIDTIRRLAAEGNVGSAIERLANKTWWPPDAWNLRGVPEEFRAQMELATARTAEEYVPLVLKALDPDWTRTF